jgi:predicted Zn-dependent peptidase
MICKYVLDNKIRVVFEQNKHFNSATVGVWVGVGSRDEVKQNNGIAHMIEHMLFKGTKTRTASDIAISTAVLGGNLNAYTSKECTSFYCKTLKEYILEAIDIIGDMICNPLLDENDLKKEKGVVCEEIDMYNDSAEDYVHEYLQMKAWKNHPLGFLISGEKKIVRKFTRDDLIDFMSNHYVGENIVISVAGNFDKEQVLNQIEKSFSGLRPTPKDITKVQKRTAPVYTPVHIEKKQDIEQIHLNIAFEIPSFVDEVRYEFTIINAILGGDVNSRLFQKIREDRGLTYNICSYGSAFSDTGLFHIYGALNPNQLERVMKLIKGIIADLVKKGITKEEFENAKKQVITEMTLNQDNTVNLMNSNAKSIMFYNKIYTFKDSMKAINDVTIESVNKCIRDYLVIDKMSVAIAGKVQ